MNVFADMRDLVLVAIARLVAEGALPEGLDLSAVMTEPPRDALHGEMATNAAMVLARPARMRPREIAAALVAVLREDARVLAADVAGPGFVNMRLAPEVWQAVPGAILSADDFGRVAGEAPVCVEYVLAGKDAALHLGQARGMVTADGIATLLEWTGHAVRRVLRLRGDAVAQGLGLPFEAVKEVADQGFGWMPEGMLRDDAVLTLNAEDWNEEGWPLRRGDGRLTALGRDVLALRDRLGGSGTGGLGAGGRLVLVLDADRGGDVRPLMAVAEALGGQLDVRLVPPVTVPGGETSVAAMEEAVGPDLMRFHLMARRPDAVLDLDPARVTEQARANPAFEVSHAYARLASVLRDVQEEDATLAAQDLRGLNDPAELALLRLLADWPRQVAIAARVMEPHRIATYLVTLAGAVDRLWLRGQENPGVRFIQDTPEETLPKIALARATAVVISAGLGILRVTPLDELR
ncbi:DALR anticodon-binding domain-containing protein [Sagittula sp. S175]|uniref:DALR anticodon-binding domain-containing protein n=1 Tax=Sagittula sp. S175 TaxID=3415129 RepID=UPI003C7E9829